MSILTINNAEKVFNNFNYTEISRTDECGQSTLVFTLENDGSEILVLGNLSGFPDKQSGSAEGYLDASDVIFKDEIGNTIAGIQLTQTPSYTEDNAFINKQFSMQFIGVKQFTMVVKTTTFAVRPSSGELAMMLCDCTEGQCESIGVNASFSISVNNQTVALVNNNSTMYF